LPAGSLQPGLGDVGDADAAGGEIAARVERALHAVEQRARRRVVFGDDAVDVLDDVPRHARIGADADRRQGEAGGRATAER
jgi:hypothetical protein